MWSLNCPPPLWSPNCLSNWSFLTHFPASLILLETPIFIVFLYKFSFKMFKFEATNWSKFQTFENQFELLAGRFVDPERPFKISPRMQAKKKKKATTNKRQQRETQTLLSAKRSVVGKKLKKFLIICWPLVCWPFSGQRPLNTIAHKKRYKTRGLLFNKTKQQNNKQQQQTNNKQQHTTTTTTNLEKERK